MPVLDTYLPGGKSIVVYTNLYSHQERDTLLLFLILSELRLGLWLLGFYDVPVTSGRHLVSTHFESDDKVCKVYYYAG